MYKSLQRILAVSAALFALAPAAPVLADAPMVKTQAPGYYRTMVGQFEVTALYDGAIELDTKLLKNAEPEDLNRMLARGFVGNPKMQTAVNAYLVNTGGNLILVDAGAAKLFGPALGFVVDNLRAAGYEPAQVDTIILTHMHPDHIGGLGDPAAPPVFPNANVYVSVLDNDFWLSPEAAAAAKPEMQDFFRMARDIAAPYQARGKWRTFADGTEIATGVRAVKAHGHTPGHSAISIESSGQKLLIWGDIVHSHAVQFALPGVSIEFDFDQTQAIATRRSLMYSLAASKTLVAGMHLPFPGIGHVRADGKGVYAWVPIEYSPLPKPAQ
ncbi:MBL fold metallo-hydrolase [Aromatoleum petrolei]|uniref:MBL fold metallo-hydrolase n=1 Tax=Aromatoleum petrolei TaxID=76116 RepID=A0ABX1MRM7_9RHOO|nr:MBL fold metallo-hydrolase [Aromatoleum petrolei]NMF89263.1 MBL fold metallo-hydrolase [Aromatoleum petrolei]QTQ35016.1 Metallo-beta-lactamase superfamily protein [Aromatoleum petrolei]